MENDERHAVMFASAEWKQRGRKPGRWILRGRCPLCKLYHEHGGGNGPHPIGGHRVNHCVDRTNHLGEVTYRAEGGYVVTVQQVKNDRT